MLHVINFSQTNEHQCKKAIDAITDYYPANIYLFKVNSIIETLEKGVKYVQS